MTKQDYIEIKSELKKLAQAIKIRKHNSRCNSINKRKLMEWPAELNTAPFLFGIERLVYEYRHKHIFLSIVRGKTREQIEKPKQGHEPDEYYITTLLERYQDVPETVCVGS